jgi:predicted DNA-binding protein
MTASHTLQIHATPYRQFPLRLPHEMANELDRIAKRTRINKTTISRIAIQKFIAEIERTGADEVFDGVCAV